MTALRRSALALLGLLAAATPGPARAEDAVRDAAHLFGAAARQEAARRIDEIREKYGQSVVIETLPALPPEERARVKAMGKHEYFEALGRERAQAAGVAEGIYILMCLSPRAVQVTACSEGEQPAFSDSDVERLRRLIARRLPLTRLVGGRDQLLLDAVNRIEETLRENRRTDGPASGLTLAAVLAGGLAVWAFLSLLNARLRRGEVREASPPGLLGSMFGTPAALWVYDRFFPRPAAPADDAKRADVPDEPPPTDLPQPPLSAAERLP